MGITKLTVADRLLITHIGGSNELTILTDGAFHATAFHGYRAGGSRERTVLCSTEHGRLLQSPKGMNITAQITLRSNECTARRLEKEMDLLLEVAEMKGIVA